MEQINSRAYWDDRFQNDWEMMRGKEQTSFFACVALALMPKSMAEEIKKSSLTICDFGCAEGQAVDVLHKQLDTEVCGIDFSETAVAKAQNYYPSYHFIQSNIVQEEIENFSVDVGYISNVLEHLKEPWKAAERAARYIRKYLMILVPFRETMEVAEHCNIFDTFDIPMHIGSFSLSFVNYMDCSEIPDTLYADDQIFLLYTKGAQKETDGVLSDLVDTFENKYQEKLAGKQAELEKAQQQKKKEEERNESLSIENDGRKAYIAKLEAEADAYEKQLSACRKEIDSCRQQLETYEKDADCMKHMVYEMQTELAQIYQSVSWKVTAPLRICGRMCRTLQNLGDAVQKLKLEQKQPQDIDMKRSGDAR